MEKRIGKVVKVFTPKAVGDDRIIGETDLSKIGFKVMLEDGMVELIKNKREVKVAITKNDLVVITKENISGKEVMDIELYDAYGRNMSDRWMLKWVVNYECAKAYYEKNGHLNVPPGYRMNSNYEEDKDGKINLGDWISNQKRTVNPDSEKGQLLSNIGISFERKTKSWEETYEYAKKYYEKYGDLEVPADFKMNSNYEEDKDGDVKLGVWVIMQRVRISPDSEKGQLLSKIGMRFDKKRNQLPWKEMYKYAKTYYEKNGNLNVPPGYRMNSNYEEDKDGKINLGDWISNQRRKVDPESERGKLLSEIGMRFETIKNMLPWEVMYEYAKVYYEKNGNLNVPPGYRMNSNYEEDKDGKINLGDWISNQRRRVKPESEKGQLLFKIGMRFDKKRNQLPWKEMYKYAKMYYEKNGNLNVSTDFRMNSNGEKDKDGAIKLGQWIVKQRFNTLPESERGKLLSQIGMRFEVLSWEKMYEYAKMYYEKYGNLRVKYSFEMNNQCEYEKDGVIKLGHWISTQRGKISPDSEKGQLLSKIGMIWDIRLNNEKIKEICAYNNIDLNINKSLVFNIPIEEFRAKIVFLKLNDIMLVDKDGRLHEIFAMSSLDVKEKYGITLEELISNYDINLESEKKVK